MLGRSSWVCGTNVVWVSDITYIATSEGWLYLAVVRDLGSRPRLSTDLVLRAFWMGVMLRHPPRGLIHSFGSGLAVCESRLREGVPEAADGSEHEP